MIKQASRINFSGVIMILITLAMMIFSKDINYPSWYPGWYVEWYQRWNDWVQAFICILIYLLLALASGDAEQIADDIAHIAWNLTNDVMDVKEKLVMLKLQLERFGEMYNRVFFELPEKPKYRTLGDLFKERLKVFFFRLYYGGIDAKQFAWICAYVSYIFFIKMNYFSIPEPFIYILVIVFIGGLQLTSVNISGMGKLIAEIFSNAREDVEKPRLNLATIISNIKTLCSMYNMISKKIEAKTNTSVNEFLERANAQISTTTTAV